MFVVTDLGSLLHTLSPELKNEVRKLEKVSLKLCKTECRELFNSVCVTDTVTVLKIIYFGFSAGRGSGHVLIVLIVKLSSFLILLFP